MNSDRPLVSVLVGTYNRAHLLPRAVHSVLRQDYDNVELLVVDDASSDNTSEVVGRIEDSRLKYVRHEENKGIATVSNTAYRASSGRYLAFLGDDDEWTDQNKLNKQVEIFEKETTSRLGIVTAWWREIAHGVVVREHSPKPPRDWMERMLMGNGLISGSVAMVTKEAWEAVGGFDECMQRGTDSELFRCIIARGFGVRVIPESVADVEVAGADRMTRADTLDKINTCMETVEYLLRKHREMYMKYPIAKGVRYYQLADMALQKCLATENRRDLSIYDSYIKKGVRCGILRMPIVKWFLYRTLGRGLYIFLRNATRVTF